MTETTREGRRGGSGHAVLLKLPNDVWEVLRAEAQRRTLPPSTAARMLLKERLDQLAAEERRR